MPQQIAEDDPAGGSVLAVAAECEGQGGADFSHAARAQLYEPAAKILLINSNHVVQIDHAGLFHPILGTKHHL